MDKRSILEIVTRYKSLDEVPEFKLEKLNLHEINCIVTFYTTSLKNVDQIIEAILFFENHPDHKETFDKYREANQSLIVKSEILKQRCQRYDEVKQAFDEFEQCLDDIKYYQQQIESISCANKEVLERFNMISENLVSNIDLLQKIKN